MKSRPSSGNEPTGALRPPSAPSLPNALCHDGSSKWTELTTPGLPSLKDEAQLRAMWTVRSGANLLRILRETKQCEPRNWF